MSNKRRPRQGFSRGRRGCVGATPGAGSAGSAVGCQGGARWCPAASPSTQTGWCADALVRWPAHEMTLAVRFCCAAALLLTFVTSSTLSTARMYPCFGLQVPSTCSRRTGRQDKETGAGLHTTRRALVRCCCCLTSAACCGDQWAGSKCSHLVGDLQADGVPQLGPKVHGLQVYALLYRHMVKHAAMLPPHRLQQRAAAAAAAAGLLLRLLLHYTASGCCWSWW